MSVTRWVSGDDRYTIVRTVVDGARVNSFFVAVSMTFTASSDEGLTSEHDCFEDAVHWCAEDSRRRRNAPEAETTVH